MTKNWFEIKNISQIDSPSLLVYKERLTQNIDRMITMVDGNANRLMPHVKTNKCVEVVQLMINKGISQFKASTIAEAEMAAIAGASKVLIAHQLVGPKIERFISLCQKYTHCDFSFLVDNAEHLKRINEIFASHSFSPNVYIDVNNGMNRSGVEPGKLANLIEVIESKDNFNLLGLHIYDGHHRQKVLSDRISKIEHDFAKIETGKYQIIAGGSPAFNVHILNKSRICSPGTSVFWDWGYGENFAEQGFNPAALLVTRVISKPTKGIITIDLGHKAVAAENEIAKRVKFLNLENYELLSQSEEHGVLSVKDWNKMEIGDVLYGIPYHVCPSVNLYEEMGVVENQLVSQYWHVIARKRKITI